ncbi:phosphonate C-P lyase system protein PhnH [Cetobacterium sp.]|uniref:phosphonate C-P lyase system protein PhnH n=1 Tax=Cetobacterium sp. TaxID=2071632 RepID=UPI003EE6E49D
MKLEKFDFVHDVQRIYRKLLDSTSKPGTINCVEQEVEKIDVHCSLSKGLMGMAYTLLNIESKFFIEDKKEAEYIRLHTFAREKEIESAEFIFLDSKVCDEKKIIHILEQINIGTLENPHEGATLILKVPKISEDKYLELKGPGIKNSKFLKIETLGEDFFGKRAEINREFPLGVDMVFLDELGNICVLPRTTKVEVNR